MRIAVLGTRGVPARYSGIERHVEELGARVAAAGHEVVVFCQEEPGLTAYRGMARKVLPAVRTKHLETATHTALAAGATLRGYDIVHFHAVGPCLFSPLTRVASKARIVATIHGRDSEREKWGGGARVMLRLGERISARVPDATVVVSRSLQQHYAAAYGRETLYVPNGVVPASRAPADGAVLGAYGLASNGYLLFVGRLVPEKGLHHLLEAFRATATPLRLAIVGGTAHTSDYIERLKRTAAADPRVVMTGPVYGPALRDLYAGAAAFVSPASLEAAPLTVLEAAAAGLPLVVTSIDAHREVQPSERPGWRVAQPRSAPSLAAAIGRLLESLDADRAAAADRVAEILATYSWDRVADLTLDVYERARMLRR